MNISGIGSLSDSTRYSNLNVEEQVAQQEAGEEYALQATTVRQAAHSDTNYQGESGSYATDQSDSVSAMARSSAGILESLESSDGEDSTNQTLINKANSGQQLSQSELSRLKEVDPALYTRVMQATQARAELRSTMSRNPSEASRAVQTALSQYGGEEESVTRQALVDEYRGISSKYDQADFGRLWAW